MVFIADQSSIWLNIHNSIILLQKYVPILFEADTFHAGPSVT